MIASSLPVRRLWRALALALLGASLQACQTFEAFSPAATTGTTAVAVSPAPSKPLDAVKSDLDLGKEHYRAGHFGLAELHFRRAVENERGDAEAWLGLAATYDRLRRFDLADRAYSEALAITGPSAAFLNNRGYSYMLRGDVRRASEDLSRAAAADPDDERIQVNLRALDQRARRRG